MPRPLLFSIRQVKPQTAIRCKGYDQPLATPPPLHPITSSVCTQELLAQCRSQTKRVTTFHLCNLYILPLSLSRLTANKEQRGSMLVSTVRRERRHAPSPIRHPTPFRLFDKLLITYQDGENLFKLGFVLRLSCFIFTLLLYLGNRTPNADGKQSE